MKKDILSILDIDREDLERLLRSASNLKSLRNGKKDHALLPKKTLGMIFEKSSTRTRISFEVGMYELGGHALFLNRQDLQLGRGEEISDTGRVLSRYLSGIMIRAYRHSTIKELAKYSTIPVINGLSDQEHPCQILADILTIKEHFGEIKGLKIAWVGDGNNVCNSLVLSSAITGYSVNVATPEGYRPSKSILDAGTRAGADFAICSSPDEAVKDADIVYTDTWVSMGNEEEQKARVRAFHGYTVDERMMESASSDAVVMHCLPAHRGEEITDEVMEGRWSVIWDQAENRLHAQKALLVMLMGEDG